MSFFPPLLHDWLILHSLRKGNTSSKKKKNGNIAYNSNMVCCCCCWGASADYMYGLEKGRDANFSTDLLLLPTHTQTSQRCQIILKDSFIFTPNKINNIRKSNRTTQAREVCACELIDPCFWKCISLMNPSSWLSEGSFHKCNKMQKTQFFNCG